MYVGQTPQPRDTGKQRRNRPERIHEPSQGMNTKPLFVYSRIAQLAGSRPRKEAYRPKTSVEPFRGNVKK